MTVLPSPVPHPLEYCPFDVPDWAFEALEWVVGFDWPAGDEVGTWDVADRWYGLAASLTEPHETAFDAATRILTGYGGSGITADGFHQAWQAVAGGDDAPLNALLPIARGLGEIVEGCGRDLEAAKLEAWIEIGIFLTELAGMAVAVALTFGAASPAAGGLIMATRITIQQIFKRLIEQLGAKALQHTARRAIRQISTKEGLGRLGRTALREGLEEAREELATNAGIQLYQQGNGRQHGFDLSSLGMSTAAGLAGGASASGAHLGAHGHHSTIRGAGGEVLAEFGAAAVFGQLPTAANLAKSGVSGASTAGIHGTTSEFTTNLSRTAVGGPLLDSANSPPAARAPTANPAAATSANHGAATAPTAAANTERPADHDFAVNRSTDQLLTDESVSDTTASTSTAATIEQPTGNRSIDSASGAHAYGSNPSFASVSDPAALSPSTDSLAASSPHSPLPHSADEASPPAATSPPGPSAVTSPAPSTSPPTPTAGPPDFQPSAAPHTTAAAPPLSSAAPDLTATTPSPSPAASPSTPTTPPHPSDTPPSTPTALSHPSAGSPPTTTPSPTSATAPSTPPTPSVTPATPPSSPTALSPAPATPASTPTAPPHPPATPTAPPFVAAPSATTPSPSWAAPDLVELSSISPLLPAETASSPIEPGRADLLPGAPNPTLITSPRDLADPQQSNKDQVAHALASGPTGPAPAPHRPSPRWPNSLLSPHRNPAISAPRPPANDAMSDPSDAAPHSSVLRPHAPSISPSPPRDPSDAPPPPAVPRDETGYFGYAHRARHLHELNRREEHAAYLTTVADVTRIKILGLGVQAEAAFRDGSTLRGEEHRRRARELSQVVAEIESEVDEIRAGVRAPARVGVDNPNEWIRINTDVGNLAPGGVRTDDRSALAGSGGSAPIDQTRRYHSSGGLRPPLAVHQMDLEDAMPRDRDGRVRRLADPRVGHWFRLANDGGPTADPTRGLNCVDGVLALFDTYVHGRPRVSAPRTFDAYAHGNPDRPLGGEIDGVRRINQATGGSFQGLCPYLGAAPAVLARPAMDQALQNLTNHLHNTGHGAFAFIITDMEAGGCHAWSAVNHHGTILFLDPQVGRLTENVPLYHHHGVPAPSNIVSMDALVVDGHGSPAPLPHHGPGQWSSPPTGTDSVDPARAEPPDHLLHRPDAVSSRAQDLEWRMFEALPASDQALLRESVRASSRVAARISADLHAVVEALGTADGHRPAIVGQEHCLKSVASIARGYVELGEFERADVATYIGQIKDRVRFSVELPEAEYGPAVVATVEALEARGYRVGKRLCFWGPGGRHNGLNMTVTEPDGFVWELQFPTPLATSVGKGTHADYEIVRQQSFDIQERVEAFIKILAANKDADMDEHQPRELNAIPDLVWKDSSFSAWRGSNCEWWQGYLDDLAADRRTFQDVFQAFGLTHDDVFPHSEWTD